MRIALSLALVAVLSAACSKKEEAAKAPEAAAPAAPAAPALAAADLEGPKPGKWKMTTTLSAAPKPVTVETCVAQTSFKDMDAAKQKAGVTCTEQSYRREGADIGRLRRARHLQLPGGDRAPGRGGADAPSSEKLKGLAPPGSWTVRAAVFSRVAPAARVLPPLV